MNDVNVGDVVLWNFVFDVPEAYGTVIEIRDGRYLVRCGGWDVGSEEWMDRDDFVVERDLEQPF